MKKIAVISGKGGTGKTVVTASFAALASCGVLADCDVDAADLHLLTKPRKRERHEFRSGYTAKINPELCKRCGRCREVCRFEAVSRDFEIDSIDCEGCGLCEKVCPCNAVVMEENFSGEWFISDTEYGTLVHARLGIGEENSGKLVSLVKQVAFDTAEKEKAGYVIIDGPPGTGCPVIATLSDIDLAVVVTEPTLSGIHDMERVIGVAGHFGISVAVVINKYDLNSENSRLIEENAGRNNVFICGHIPFSASVNEAVVKGVCPVNFCEAEVVEKIKDSWKNILRHLGDKI
ncbi:MAG: (4Fe-4S)-binding protein [Candidatus Omnitrophica bacterium]|nr:(4Fe-4S)-binding protein [Candidatus Omnitrophota bacterium]MBD3269510.1 (4Fe-4S)-binding protein [Candidatus Omnitrophota bacterium]